MVKTKLRGKRRARRTERAISRGFDSRNKTRLSTLISSGLCTSARRHWSEREKTNQRRRHGIPKWASPSSPPPRSIRFAATLCGLTRPRLHHVASHVHLEARRVRGGMGVGTCEIDFISCSQSKSTSGSGSTSYFRVRLKMNRYC